jgi:hypothetical protein
VLFQAVPAEVAVQVVIPVVISSAALLLAATPPSPGDLCSWAWAEVGWDGLGWAVLLLLLLLGLHVLLLLLLLLCLSLWRLWRWVVGWWWWAVGRGWGRGLCMGHRVLCTACWPCWLAVGLCRWQHGLTERSDRTSLVEA